MEFVSGAAVASSWSSSSSPRTISEKQSIYTGPDGTSYFFGPDTPLPSIESDPPIPTSPEDGAKAAAAADNEQAPAPAPLPNETQQSQNFVFLKGKNAEGNPILTVYRAGATASFAYDPNQHTAKARFDPRANLSHFIKAAVVGALAYKGTVIKLATSQSKITGLDAASSRDIIWKPIWRERVKRLAPLLKLKIGSPHDAGKGGCRLNDPASAGSYHSSHVEKKLATFALYNMLGAYGIPVGRYVTIKQIRALREKVIAEEEKIQLDILITRKWCTLCLAFVQRVSRVSGLELRIRVQPLVERLAAPAPSAMPTKMGPISGDAVAFGGKTYGTEYEGETFTEEELRGGGGGEPATCIAMDYIYDEGPGETVAGCSDGENAETAEKNNADPKATVPTAESVSQFSANLQSFTHVPGRANGKRYREPLFKRKPLPPTPEIAPPSGPLEEHRSSQGSSRQNTVRPQISKNNPLFVGDEDEEDEDGDQNATHDPVFSLIERGIRG